MPDRYDLVQAGSVRRSAPPLLVPAEQNDPDYVANVLASATTRRGVLTASRLAMVAKLDEWLNYVPVDDAWQTVRINVTARYYRTRRREFGLVAASNLTPSDGSGKWYTFDFMHGEQDLGLVERSRQAAYEYVRSVLDECFELLAGGALEDIELGTLTQDGQLEFVSLAAAT